MTVQRGDHSGGRTSDSMSLKAIATPAAVEPGPLVTRCRSLTVAKVDSIGLVVRRWIQLLGGMVIARQQHIEVISDLRGRFGPLIAVEVGEGLGQGQGVVTSRGSW